MIVNRFPSLRLIIAGDGPARPELERRTVELGLSESVEFLGWVGPDVVADLLSHATVVLMPSRRESLLIVAVQAALAGRPIIAVRVYDLPEVVAHGETGLLVEREDTKGLAKQSSFCSSNRRRPGTWAGRRASAHKRSSVGSDTSMLTMVCTAN